MFKPIMHTIFDFDGTIANSSPGIFNAISYVTQCMGLQPLSEEQKRKHIGPPIDKAYGDSFGINEGQLKKATGLHKQYMYEKGYKELVFYQGMEKIIEDLKKAGIIVSIATLKSDEVIKKICREFGFLSKVDIVHGYDDNPETNKAKLIGKCISESGIGPEFTIMIGDTEHDLNASLAAGIGFIGVSYGFGTWCREVQGSMVKGIAKDTIELYDIITATTG